MHESSRPPRQRVSISDLLSDESIVIDATASDRTGAVREAGSALVSAGAVTKSYIEGMVERENAVSTYVGEGIAFPHATAAQPGSVLRDAIAVVLFPRGISWGDETVYVAIAIAAEGRGHIGILAALASALLEPATSDALRRASTRDEVRAILEPA